MTLEQLGYDIGYFLYTLGLDSRKNDDIPSVRKIALKLLKCHGIQFSSLEERGNFFISIGKGQADARLGKKNKDA